MEQESKSTDRLLEYLIELIEIPPSHYEKATERYKSVGEWLSRAEGDTARYSPEVFPQGSFRYGTVIRPLNEKEEYDLDLVCGLSLDKKVVTQERVKNLVGIEIGRYAKAFSFKEPAEEKARCWRLNYADDVSFHMDILPCIPDSGYSTVRLLESRVLGQIVDTTVAITDKGHHRYRDINPDWPISNPRGFAVWFEGRMKPAALSRLQRLVENRLFASIDDVPTFEWKTPLQRAIQILKRHRDLMFSSDPKLKPISMIITTLSAEAYGGESDLREALTNIVKDMPKFVRPTKPRIPNPVDPAEDFADKWSTSPRLEENFWLWHAQAKADLDRLSAATASTDGLRVFKQGYGIRIGEDVEKRMASLLDRAIPAVLSPSRATRIVQAPKPWRRGL